MGHTLWKWLGGLPTYSDFWNAFWAAVFGALAGAGAAFELERRRRKAERTREEISKCYTLHFYVMHMASILGDFQEHLFGNEQPGTTRRGSLDGVPERGADFETKEYAFLLDGSDDGTSLALLNKVYLARVNFNSTLTRLHIRNRLWSELFERRVGSNLAGAYTAIDRMGQQQAVEARIEQLTEWLRIDFRETIEELEAIQPLLQQVFHARYPKQHLIVSVRKSDAAQQGGPEAPAP